VIEPKAKPCKANYRAPGVTGCGALVYERTYGLCQKCYKKWLITTEEGNEKLNKLAGKVKKDNEKKRERDQREEKQRRKVDIMSADEYRAKYIQPLINLIARLIDNNQACISSGTLGKMSGGHYHSVGSNRTLALNLHNVHRQSYHSNSKKGGDHVKYRAGLIKEYGEGYTLFVDQTLNQCPPLKLSKQELQELKPILVAIKRKLEEIDKTYTAQERIDTRNELNAVIGVYPEQFAEYEPETK